jgi:hypothetical protein
MEGIPDHHEPSFFTEGRSRWSWRLPHASRRLELTGARADEPAKVGLDGAEEGEATGMPEARSYEGSVGRTTPTLAGLRTFEDNGSCRSAEAFRAS